MKHNLKDILHNIAIKENKIIVYAFAESYCEIDCFDNYARLFDILEPSITLKNITKHIKKTFGTSCETQDDFESDTITLLYDSYRTIVIFNGEKDSSIDFIKWEDEIMAAFKWNAHIEDKLF